MTEPPNTEGTRRVGITLRDSRRYYGEPPNTEDEQQWWRVLYSNGSERIAGPWFPTKEEASEWALDSPLVSKRAMRSIRYEADVRSEPL